MKFFTSLSTGHSGTKWLAQVLNTSEDITCHHELKLNMHRSYPRLRFGKNLWKYAEQFDYDNYLNPSAYTKYIRSLSQAKTEYVGDIQSWNPTTLTTLRGTIAKPDIVIHIIRNGIQVVHSLHNTNLDTTKDEPFFHNALKLQCEHFGIEFLNDQDPFYYWCLYWKVVNCAEARHKATESYNLESITQDIQLLDRVFSGCRFKEVPEQNRKITGNRDPEYLWNSWDVQQRSIFWTTCRNTMISYGYEIPRD